MEQRLVRAMSKKASKRSRRRHRRLPAASSPPQNTSGFRRLRGGGESRLTRNLRRPGRLFLRLWRRRRQRVGGDEAATAAAIEEEEEIESRSSTPRYILDKEGIFRWPPIKMEDGSGQILRKVKRKIYLKEGSLKGQCHEIFRFRFYHESSYPKPLKMTLGHFELFRKFAEIFASQGALQISTTPVENLAVVSTTPVANLPAEFFILE